MAGKSRPRLLALEPIVLRSLGRRDDRRAQAAELLGADHDLVAGDEEDRGLLANAHASWGPDQDHVTGLERNRA